MQIRTVRINGNKSRSALFLLFVALMMVLALMPENLQVSHVSAQTDNKSVFKAYVDAYNADIKTGDTTQIATYYAPDFVDETAPQGANGLEYAKKSFVDNSVSFPDVKLKILDTVAEGDKLVVFTLFTGTNTGSLRGLPPTGRKVALKGIGIITLKDGKFIKADGVDDTLTALTQLGFTITPPQAGAVASPAATGTK